MTKSKNHRQSTHKLGPLEVQAWPDTISARVVSPGSSRAIHGYAVDSDLARHYGFLHVLNLALNGELPTDEQVQYLDVAMTLLAPISVAEAPTHAAYLARLCGARSSALLGTGLVTLAEQAHDIVQKHQAFLMWLRTRSEKLPDCAVAQSDDERNVVSQLRQMLLERELVFEAGDVDLSRDALILALLYQAGIRRNEHIEMVFVMARAPCLLAEALAIKPRRFRDYPMNLPEFDYEEGP